VSAVGALDAADSKNVTATAKDSTFNGAYCVQTAVPVKNGVASTDVDGVPPRFIGLTMVLNTVQDVCLDELPNANVLVYIRDNAVSAVNQVFYVAFN
jgi:hypothetical protein